MPLYLAIHSRSGVMHRLNTSLKNITPLGTDEAVLVLDAYDVEPDPAALRYDPGLRAYGAAPVPVTQSALGSRGDFMRRLGFARETYLNAVRLNAASDITTRALLETLLSWLNRVDGVDVTDPITVAGVAMMAAVLDAGGHIPEGVPTFTAAMLAPFPV